MSLEVEATYENGVLKLDQPLALNDKQRVTVTGKPHATGIWSHGGSFKWTGAPEVLRLIAEDEAVAQSAWRGSPSRRA